MADLHRDIATIKDCEKEKNLQPTVIRLSKCAHPFIIGHMA